jgi:hypothetical protein
MIFVKKIEIQKEDKKKKIIEKEGKNRNLVKFFHAIGLITANTGL